MARLQVMIDDELNKRLNFVLPHGLKSELVRALLERVAEQIETDGAGIVGPILAGDFRIVQNLNKSGTGHET